MAFPDLQLCYFSGDETSAYCALLLDASDLLLLKREK